MRGIEDLSAVGDVLVPLIEQLTYTDERAAWAPGRRSVDRRPLPREIRTAVLHRDNHTCCWCFASARRKALLAIDHIVPWSAGGADHPVNLRVLCDDCNRDRSNHVTDMHTAWVLPIASRCLTCAVPVGTGTAVPVHCLRCGTSGSSPFMLLGGRIPAAGIPPAWVEVVAQRQRPVTGEAIPIVRAAGGVFYTNTYLGPPYTAAAPALDVGPTSQRAQARAELDAIRPPDGATGDPA